MEKGKTISAMKGMAEQYPVELQKSLIHLFSFETEFSLWLAENSIDKDDIYYVTAHVIRSVSRIMKWNYFYRNPKFQFVGIFHKIFK